MHDRRAMPLGKSIRGIVVDAVTVEGQCGEAQQAGGGLEVVAVVGEVRRGGEDGGLGRGDGGDDVTGDPGGGGGRGGDGGWVEEEPVPGGVSCAGRRGREVKRETDRSSTSARPAALLNVLDTPTTTISSPLAVRVPLALSTCVVSVASWPTASLLRDQVMLPPAHMRRVKGGGGLNVPSVPSRPRAAVERVGVK